MIDGSHVLMLLVVFCRWSRFPRSACHGSVHSLFLCSCFKLLGCSTCAPGSCPCLPRLSQTQAAYIYILVTKITAVFIYYILYGWLCYIAWFFFPSSFWLHEDDLHLVFLIMLRGFMTILRTADWVCEFLLWHYLVYGLDQGWWVEHSYTWIVYSSAIF